MTLAIVLFAVAAVWGAMLASLHLQGKALPWAAAIIHGGLAAAGLVALIVAAATGANTPGLAKVALAIFIVAALGGFVLFSFFARKQKLPTPLVFVHGIAAVVAFVLLLIGKLGG